MLALPVLFSLVLSGLVHAEPREEAVIALAEGRQARALQLLSDGVSAGGEDAQELRCLLGRIQHQAGRHTEALETLGFVSESAPCALGAAWVRAEAMLALGREEEAGAVYARLSEVALGSDRDARTVARLLDLSDRVLAREEPGVDQAVESLGLALQLTVDEETQLGLARRLVDLAVELGDPGRAWQAMPVLALAVDRDGEVEDRRRLASLVGGSAGLAILEGLPADLETQLLRLDLGSGRDPSWQLAQLEALVDAHPQASETRLARLRMGRVLAGAGWQGEAEAVLEPLGEGQDEVAAEAAERLARLALSAGDDAAAVARLERLLERFPHAEQRAWAEQQLEQTLWREGERAAAAGEHARASELFLRLAGQGSARAAYAAGLMARALGEPDQARRLWLEIPARWPGSDDARDAMWGLFRLQAHDQDDPDGAVAWLEERAEAGLVDASWLLEELDEPSLAVESDGVTRVGGHPSVRVLSRGHERLELRLHRVDLEAWLRAGWSLDRLPDLDLGIIEPDRVWELDLHDVHPQRIASRDVPVSTPGPGLFAVTVASTEREARTLMLRSDARVVAQRAGPHLAVAVFAGGRPVPGARVLVREDSTVVELRTDSTGLAQAEHRGGPLLVLASSSHGPALLELDGVESPRPDGAVISTVDLDRPVYLPGDRLGFRLAVDRAVSSERSDWTLWLEGGGGFTALARQVFHEGPDGTIVGELPLPLASTGHAGIAANGANLTLMAQRPDGTELRLAVVPVVDRVPEGRHLELRAAERSVNITLLEESGDPAVGVPVDWTWVQAEQTGRVVTDAQGQARLDGPPQGVPWTVEASVPGTSLSARAWRMPVVAAPWSLEGGDDRLRSGERLGLMAAGEGAATLRVVRLHAAQEPEPLADPWGLEPRWTQGLEGPEGWYSLQPVDTRGLRETVHRAELTLDGEQRVDLPALSPGRYRAELLPASGAGVVSTWDFEVDDAAVRLRVPASVGAGEQLKLTLEGEPALVMLRSNDQVEAMVLRPGQSWSLPAPARWRDEVTVAASAPSGASHHRTVGLSPALVSRLAVDEEAEGWRVRVEVVDAAGRPARAQVALRAVDLTLERRVGRAPSLAVGPMRPGLFWSRVGGWGGALRLGAFASAVSQALLEEVAREEEARRALRASSGQLMDNAVQAALGEDVPLSLGLGGLGTMGMGSGGGGSAYGCGGLGTAGRGSGGSGSPQRPLQGERDRVLWAVLETDELGVVELIMPTPPRAGQYRVEAVALAHGWVARDERVVASAGARPGEGRAKPEPARSLPAVALAVDPHVDHEAGRAAVAARAALATLPLLEGEARAEALDRVRSLLGALSASPMGYRGVGEAAQALALLGELGELWTLPRGTLEDFDAAIDVEGASRGDRVALVWARARAGLPVDDASIARLLREPEQLSPEQASELARALILMDRRPEARRLVAGAGPQAVLARLALSSRRSERKQAEQDARALLAGAPPPVGSVARPAWIAAVASVWQGEDLPEETPVADLPLHGCAQRLPLSADGLPVRAYTSASLDGDPPCREGLISLAVGDALRVDGDLSRAWLPAGLERIPDPSGAGFLVRAAAPGRHRLGMIERKTDAVDLMVEVAQGEPEAVAQDVALALAQERWARGEDPAAWLSARPRLEDWHPHLQAGVARLRFQQAVLEGAAAEGLVAAFEDLRDVEPRGQVSFDEVLATARAYGILRPQRAMEIQRTAIGAAFLDEAAIASRLERVLGPLAAIQVLWEIAGRYPAVPVVEQALYELPDRVLDMGSGGSLPPELRRVGVTPTDLRLMSAAWNREFVVLHPGSALAPLAGRRLVVDLLHLGAWDQAAGWAARLSAEHPQHELCDSFLYLEGLARSAAGDHRQAAALLRRVNKLRFVQPDGLEGPSELRMDAELALARLLEARGDRAGAVAAYSEAASELDEAQASVLQLRHRSLDLDELLLLEPGEPAVLPVTVAGVDRIFLRAYRLDLRTLFLRDSGLQGVEQVQVAGISPAWSGERSVPERPFAREHDLRLPLTEAGAWLVQLHAGDQARTMLVVRSELELAAMDAGGLRRVTVLRRGKPAAGVQVRAIAGGKVVAAITDQRGVAIVPAYAPVLAFDGVHYAFTQAHRAGVQDLSFEGGDELLRRVDQRLEQEREQHRSRYQHIGVSGGSGMEASAL